MGRSRCSVRKHWRRRAEGFGKPVALLPLSWSVLIVCLLAMVVSAAGLLLTGNYSRKATASGVVRSVGGDIRVSIPATGIVKSLLVREGQQVRAGDTIMTVTTARTGVDGRAIDEKALASLDREIANLEGRLLALDAAAGIEHQGGLSRLAALRGERRAAKAAEVASLKRSASAKEALARIELVARKGFISGEALRRRQEEIICYRPSSG